MAVDVGFIGTGGIAAAMVTGFSSGAGPAPWIHLSPRNAQRAAELARRFPNVDVAASNQEVLDRSEWVIVAVLPDAGERILRPLRFRQDHRVVNLMSGRPLPEIAGWIGPTRTLVHLVPLPFVARRIGPLAIHPHDPDAEALLAPLGELVAVNDPQEIQVLQNVTCLMASYYHLLRDVVRWGEGHGVERGDVLTYAAGFFEALSRQARLEGPGALDRLAEEHTPGGYNEMVVRLIGEKGGIAAWIDALEPALARMRSRR